MKMHSMKSEPDRSAPDCDQMLRVASRQEIDQPHSARHLRRLFVEAKSLSRLKQGDLMKNALCLSLAPAFKPTSTKIEPQLRRCSTTTTISPVQSIMPLIALRI
jgi:hypothetical protein